MVIFPCANRVTGVFALFGWKVTVTPDGIVTVV
jgi:hypothetical protein